MLEIAINMLRAAVVVVAAPIILVLGWMAIRFSVCMWKTNRWLLLLIVVAITVSFGTWFQIHKRCSRIKDESRLLVFQVWTKHQHEYEPLQEYNWTKQVEWLSERMLSDGHDSDFNRIDAALSVYKTASSIEDIYPHIVFDVGLLALAFYWIGRTRFVQKSRGLFDRTFMPTISTTPTYEPPFISPEQWVLEDLERADKSATTEKPAINSTKPKQSDG